jgi:hypothetical protein
MQYQSLRSVSDTHVGLDLVREQVRYVAHRRTPPMACAREASVITDKTPPKVAAPSPR